MDPLEKLKEKLEERDKKPVKVEHPPQRRGMLAEFIESRPRPILRIIERLSQPPVTQASKPQEKPETQNSHRGYII